MKNLIKCSIASLIAIVCGGTYISADNSNQPIGDVYINGEYITTLRVTPKGLALIGNAEGCRLDPYKCPAGLLTNGVGNTHGVPQKPISEAQAAKDWVLNIKNSEICLAAAMPNSDIRNGQFDALASFVFNTGCTRFRTNADGSKTTIYKLVHAGYYSGACVQLYRWVYAGGVKLPGLIKRRGAEYARCVESD